MPNPENSFNKKDLQERIPPRKIHRLLRDLPAMTDDQLKKHYPPTPSKINSRTNTGYINSMGNYARRVIFWDACEKIDSTNAEESKKLLSELAQSSLLSDENNPLFKAFSDNEWELEHIQTGEHFFLHIFTTLIENHPEMLDSFSKKEIDTLFASLIQGSEFAITPREKPLRSPYPAAEANVPSENEKPSEAPLSEAKSLYKYTSPPFSHQSVEEPYHDDDNCTDEWETKLAEMDAEHFDSSDESTVFINALIQHLAPRGGKQTIDYCINLLNSFGSRISLHIDKPLSQIDPTYASTKLLEAIRSTTDKYVIYDFSRILYRLELGKIGITEEGVTYLGKQYDLQDPDHVGGFAKRISSYGQIGVFDKNDTLKGFFQLDDPNSNQERVQAEVLNISYDMLFTSDRIDESIIENFLKSYLSFSEQTFFKETKIQLNSLSLRQQMWFMHTI